ncbi:hypothetical protein [Candidatus Pantoea multigeneris]|uniref:Inner membrane protein n=1 Tax=Candidatus Pantoea multigeneris TaxID=2608357 RepID=A0ABX0RFQ4_9GAMM|nr:hypothetical protein [Pantoea multigeneris]NIF24180.1 hypothetical protein [Pantoea multigeneris]
MNAFEYEQKLLDNGFSGKDIAVIRQHLYDGGCNYNAALKALRLRFFVCTILIFIILLGFTSSYLDEKDFITYSLSSFFVIFLFVCFNPMVLGLRVFFFLRRCSL